MRFTHSPFEREMKKIPYVPKEESAIDNFCKTRCYHKTCLDCSVYSEKEKKCKFYNCPYIKERISNGNITTLELLTPLIFEATDDYFENRLICLYKKIKGGLIKSMFKNKTHKKIFDKQIKLYKKQGYILSNKFTAALFILTADPFIWKASKYHIEPNNIDFARIDIRGIETDAYLLFKVAKDLYFKKTQVTASELADKELTKEYLFKTIINGILIARYGYDTLKLELRPKGVKHDED